MMSVILASIVSAIISNILSSTFITFLIAPITLPSPSVKNIKEATTKVYMAHENVSPSEYFIFVVAPASSFLLKFYLKDLYTLPHAFHKLIVPLPLMVQYRLFQRFHYHLLQFLLGIQLQVHPMPLFAYQSIPLLHL